MTIPNIQVLKKFTKVKDTNNGVYVISQKSYTLVQPTPIFNYHTTLYYFLPQLNLMKWYKQQNVYTNLPLGENKAQVHSHMIVSCLFLLQICHCSFSSFVKIKAYVRRFCHIMSQLQSHRAHTCSTNNQITAKRYLLLCGVLAYFPKL